MDKGISPLVAAVVLIAFVVAIAAITSGFFTDLTADWGEDVERRGATTLTCSRTNLEIVTVTWSDPDLTFSVRNKGDNALTNLTAEITSMDESITSKFFNETLNESATETYEVENITEPFKKLRFFGNACPNYDAVNEYEVEQKTVTGEVGSTSTAELTNDGDVYTRPELVINSTE